MLLFQAVTIASSRSSVHSFNLGIYTFVSATVLAGILLVQGTEIAQPLLRSSPAAFALRVAELVFSISLAVSSLCIPRRPDVFFQGDQVDRMYSASALGRYTFSWPSGLLNLAAKKKDLDLSDLTRPDQYTRADCMSANWKSRKPGGHRLWLAMVLAHKKPLAVQWFLTLCASMLNFAPQWVTLQLLRYLEGRQPGGKESLEVWMWVVWLGVAIIAQSWVESYLWWLSFSDLHIPVRAQLSALIFEKSMRRKDVKGAGKSKKKAQETESAEPAGGEPAVEVPGKPEEDDSEELKKSKQSTVNLIGVDTRRVSDFAAFQNLFPGSLFKLIVSLAFLIDLLGWKSLLAGFSAMLAIMPVNIYFSKRYAAAQDRLMKVKTRRWRLSTRRCKGSARSSSQPWNPSGRRRSAMCASASLGLFGASS